MCGENFQIVVHPRCIEGSPPRVRGKPGRSLPLAERRRITPACAGKTMRHILHTIFSKDHPRVCGENFFLYFFACTGTGSPPRVRGKHFGNGVFPWLILVLSLDLL